MRLSGPFTQKRLMAGARSVRDVAGGGWSAGVRGVKDVAYSFTEPSWSADQRTVVLPAEMRQDRLDWLLLFLTLGLFGLGLTMVFSSSTFVAQFKGMGPYDRLIGQGLRGLVGIGLLILFARLDYRRWSTHWGVLAVVTSAALLILVLIPGIGHASKGAQRWIGIPPFVIQPTEFARVALIVYLARVLSRRPERVEGFVTGPLPALLVTALFVGLIGLQKSLGSMIAMMATTIVMSIAAGMRWKHFFWLTAPVVALGGLAVLGATVFHAYQLDRIVNWIAYWLGTDNPQGETYQLHQSVMALGSGGLLGAGLGAGQQKWFFLPDNHTDFIYSIVGEEMGFVGTFGLLVALAVFIWRGLSIAGEAEDRYGYLLAAGLTANFAIYVTINLSVVTGLFPTTGLPLPLVSYGGSALIANMTAVGLLLSVSRFRGGGIILSGRIRRRSA